MLTELYLQYEYWIAAVQLIFAMLGMGATLTIGDITGVFKNPWGFGTGMVLQLIVVPVLAFLFIKALHMHTGVAIGIALCAAIPGGTASNIITYFSKGNIALSISLTAIVTIGCLVTTPLILNFLIEPYMPAEFQMPAARIATEIGAFLLLPLSMGMIIHRYIPKFSGSFSKWFIRIAFFLIVVIVAGALNSGRVDLKAFGLNIFYVILFMSILAVFSYLVPMLIRLKKRDTRAINIEITVRNSNLGLLIIASLFPASQGINLISSNALFTVLLYGGIQWLFGAIFILAGRRAEAINEGNAKSVQNA